ncbi:MAG: choice-of-anchor tandem repeat GloVer-containing protein [Candidatus Cybelea sp.]
MKNPHRLIGAWLSAAVLAACGGNNNLSSSTPMSVAPSLRSQPALGPPGTRKATLTETVLYSFQGGTDGISPYYGSLIYRGGELYGTTSAGGHAGRGTAFKITPAGAYTEIYAFAYDGWTPEAGLTSRSNSGQNLFTTTNRNGANNYGTVVKITTAGKGKLLYSFAGGNDGASPIGGLTNVGGTLYGTTTAGGGTGCGGNGCGTVFSITASGTESVLYSFVGGSDGANPYAELTNVHGTLYGTTFAGGADNTGTIFKITTTGAYSQLYSFAGGGDGSNPRGALLRVGSTLYGTTVNGGTGCSGSGGCGTVFKITTSGAYGQLYSFRAVGGDGSNPTGGLLLVGRALYGTTAYAGASNNGTVFKITTSGTETVLYRFAGGSDGANPLAGLTNVNGTLYGTTSDGGTGCGGSGGCGTVYSLTGF